MTPAFIITGLGLGGAESVLLRLLEKISWRRNAIVISLGKDGAMAPRIRDLGIVVYELGLRASTPNPFAIVSIARILRAHRIDVASTWMYHADLLGGLGAALAGVPVLWGIRNGSLSASHTSLSTRLVARLNGCLSRWLPDAIVSCSERARDVHVGLGYEARKFVVIPNGIDVDRFRPDPAARKSVREDLGIHESSLLVGLIARFDASKNHQGFIAAAGQVLASRRDIHLVMAGSGMTVENQKLVGWINGAGLSRKTHLLGPRQDIARIFSALDVSVLASTGEAFPSVLAEAMACGVPCVTTNAGDAAAIVGATGIVVPVGDMLALLAGVLELLEEDTIARRVRSEAVRARIVGQFEIGSMVSAYENLLREFSRVGSRTRH